MFSDTRFVVCKKVLVFNPSFIGDAILTTPLIRAVRALLPQAEIDFCVRPESAPLFDGLKGINIITFDKRGAQKGFFKLLQFARFLKAQKYDIVITSHKSFRSVLALKLAKIPIRIGFSESSPAVLLTDTIKRDMTLHEAERNLTLLSLVTQKYSLADAKRLGGSPITIYDKHYAHIASTFMTSAAQGRKIVGLSPGSAWATKRWPAEYFAQTAKILNDSGYALAVFGGPADHNSTDELKSLMDTEYFDYADKVPFRQIPTLIKHLDLMITNDSAPLHIAVSQGTPVVAIFGATVPSLGFAPYDDVSVVCENVGLYCRPCGLHGGNTCPQKHFRCMLEVTPKDVAEAAIRLLSRNGAVRDE